MGLARHRMAARLARWLGPWADSRRVPAAVVRRAVVFADRDATAASPVRGYHFAPAARAASGCYLVVQGLHFAGPNDPRMDRFCRVLADCGIEVFAPFIRSFGRLQVSAQATADVAAALRHAQRHCRTRGLPRPGVFTISFGSYPAIQAAADPALREGVGGLVLFGGFADFAACIRFAVSKRAFSGQRPLWLPHDPLNTPAVMINVLPHVPVPGAREPLIEALLEQARQTWGRPALRPPGRRQPIADAIARGLPPAQRPLLYMGAGLSPGAAALTEVALGRARGAFAFTDVTAALRSLAAPVTIAHGRDDDVIPYVEAHKLAAGLPPGSPRRLLLTGLYGHTGAELPGDGLAGELRTMRALLYAIVDGAHGRGTST